MSAAVKAWVAWARLARECPTPENYRQRDLALDRVIAEAYS
jgi:hypothetical protein